MNSPGQIKEEHLYEIWSGNKFNNPLQLPNGDDVEVISIGEHNTDTAGPDFINAKIRVGSLSYVGDVEIDIDYRDWKRHGHNINARFNKVILHIALYNKFNQAYVYNKEGRKIPSVNFYENINKSLKIKKPVYEKKTNEINKLKCRLTTDELDKNISVDFVKQLGVKRFEKKCNRIYERLKELSYINSLQIEEPVIKYKASSDFLNKDFTHEDFNDRKLWQQVFYEFIFEALGYSQNKSIMMNLARSVNIDFLIKISKKEDFINVAESSFFSISGLIPDVSELPRAETSEYTKQLSGLWNKNKKLYDGEFFLETDWHFFKLRPPNFPTIRIAGGIRILYQLIYQNLISVIIKKITEIRKPEVIINSLRSVFVIKSDGYWQKHYIFDKHTESIIKYFIGAARADEILINVVFPFFTVYFDVFSKEYLSKKILEIYNIFEQRGSNKIERTISENLQLQSLSKRTLYAQGMIELFRNYCSKGRCLECNIGKNVFDK